MTRIIERSGTAPHKIMKDDIDGKALFVCACGLSANQPFCDGSHAKTRDERDGVLYQYVRAKDGMLERGSVRVESRDDHEDRSLQAPRSAP